MSLSYTFLVEGGHPDSLVSLLPPNIFEFVNVFPGGPRIEYGLLFDDGSTRPTESPLFYFGPEVHDRFDV